MLHLNDKVRVTKEAREDTYDNAWWTKEELVIDHIYEDKSVTEYEERVYSFKAIDGKEVPVSLYEYELELIDKCYSR